MPGSPDDVEPRLRRPQTAHTHRSMTHGSLLNVQSSPLCSASSVSSSSSSFHTNRSNNITNNNINNTNGNNSTTNTTKSPEKASLTLTTSETTESECETEEGDITSKALIINNNNNKKSVYHYYSKSLSQRPQSSNHDLQGATDPNNCCVNTYMNYYNLFPCYNPDNINQHNHKHYSYCYNNYYHNYYYYYYACSSHSCSIPSEWYGRSDQGVADLKGDASEVDGDGSVAVAVAVIILSLCCGGVCKDIQQTPHPTSVDSSRIPSGAIVAGAAAADKAAADTVVLTNNNNNTL